MPAFGSGSLVDFKLITDLERRHEHVKRKSQSPSAESSDDLVCCGWSECTGGIRRVTRSKMRACDEKHAQLMEKPSVKNLYDCYRVHGSDNLAQGDIHHSLTCAVLSHLRAP
jgi:hypothetical protein